jgi:hypothetical protein
MMMEDFKDAGAEMHHESLQARARDEAFDPSKPRPWLLGWQDADKMLAELAEARDVKKPPTDFQKAALERLLEVAMRGTGQWTLLRTSSLLGGTRRSAEGLISRNCGA